MCSLLLKRNSTRFCETPKHILEQRESILHIHIAFSLWLSEDVRISFFLFLLYYHHSCSQTFHKGWKEKRAWPLSSPACSITFLPFHSIPFSEQAWRSQPGFLGLHVSTKGTMSWYRIWIRVCHSRTLPSFYEPPDVSRFRESWRRRPGLSGSRVRKERKKDILTSF